MKQQYFRDHIVKLRPRLLTWYRRVARPLPWRVLWQKSGDPYVVWVSEIMLQQTVIKAVIPVYERFLSLYPTVHDLAQTSEDQLRLAVRGLGYYRRFGFMLKAAAIIDQHIKSTGSWPSTHKEWRELPGIGDYTAAAVSSIAFNEPYGVVDGNVERVFCRLLDLREPPNSATLKREFKDLVALFICKKSPGDFNQALMELGQTVCTVTKPTCSTCPLQSGCLAFSRTSQHLAPQPKLKTAPIPVALTLAVPIRGDMIGICQRPAQAKFLAGTWGFVTIYDDKSPKNPIGVIKHHITHHKITATVTTNTAKSTKNVRWLHPDDVERNLISNLDRKAWLLFQQKR